MLIARVVGSVVSTAKDEGLRGASLLVVRPTSVTDEVLGPPLVAVDTVGAGEGELVLVARGGAARLTATTEGLPTDAAIVGILDSVELEGEDGYRKS